MSYSRYRTADFGLSKAGLGTVGYTVSGVRTTAGISEVAPGVYAATVTFADGFTGPIVWDSGEGAPVYVVGAVNPGSDENEDAKVTSRSTFAGGAVASVTAPVQLDLTQALTDVKTSTVGGALHGAFAVAFGKMILDATAKVLKLFGFNSQSVPLQAFDLDSGTSPTTRTPQ